MITDTTNNNSSHLSFIVTSLQYITRADYRETGRDILKSNASVCAILTHSRKQFNSSSVPAVLMNDRLWKDLGGRTEHYKCDNVPTGKYEEKWFRIFRLSDTMQFSSTLVFYNDGLKEEFFDEVVVGYLMKNYRYFTRSLKHLRVPSDDNNTNNTKLIEKICNDSTLCASLESLIMEDADLSPAGDSDPGLMKKCLPKLRALRKLELPACYFSEEDLKFLFAPPPPSSKEQTAEEEANNKTNNNNMSLPMTTPSSTMCHLEELCLSDGGEGVTDGSLKVIAGACPRLTKLNISSCEEVTDEGMANFLKIRRQQQHKTSVESLIASYTNLSDKAMEELSLFSNSSRLHTLTLDNCESITDKSLEFVSKIDSLVSLNLASCHAFGDEGIKAIACLPKLEWLCLWWCSKVSTAGLSELTKCKTLKYLDVREQGVDNDDEVLQQLKEALGPEAEIRPEPY